MAYIMVDVESDGPIPGDYSMVCFGAIVVEPNPVDDARGNAEALLQIKEEFGLKIGLK